MPGFLLHSLVSTVSGANSLKQVCVKNQELEFDLLKKEAEMSTREH